MSTIANVYHGLLGWSNATYAVGARRSNAGNAYEVITAGTSTVPPSGTGSDIAPGGTAHWKYVSAVDYTSFQAWFDALPSTLTDQRICYVRKVGVITPSLGVSILSMSGKTTSSVNNILIQPAPGEGFLDYFTANPTAPFFYSTTNGVSIEMPSSGVGAVNYIDINVNYVTIRGLQLRDPNASSGSTIVHGTGSNVVVEKCIIDGYSQPGGAQEIQFEGTPFTLRNCLIIERSTNAEPTVQFPNIEGCKVVNCTFVATQSVSGRAPLDCGTAGDATNLSRNNIFVGWDQNYWATGGSPWTTDHNAYTTAAIGGNASDSGGSIYNIVAADTFVNATSDFHLKSGASSINAGATDATNVPSEQDIFGTSRPQGAAWDIGAHELLAGSTILRDFIIPITMNVGKSRDLIAALGISSVTRFDSGSSIDFLANRVSDVRIPADWLNITPPSAPSNRPFTEEFSDEFGDYPSTPPSDAIIPIEWTSQANLRIVDKAIPIEWKSSIRRDEIISLSRSATIRADRIVFASWRLTFSADRLNPTEFGASRRADRPVGLNFLSSLRRDFIFQIEYKGSTATQRDVVFPVDWLASRRTDHVLNIEWLIPSVTEDVPIPLSWEMTRRRDDIVSADWASSLTPVSTTFNVEHLSSRRVDTPIVVSYAKDVRSDSLIPLAPLSLTYRDAVVNIDSVFSVRAETSFSFDWRGTLGASFPILVEWRSIYVSNNTVSIEWTGELRADRVAPVSFDNVLAFSVTPAIDWTNLLRRSDTFPIEFNQNRIPVSVDFNITVEILSTVRSDTSFTFEQGLGQKGFGSLIVPDEWERVHGQ